MNWWLLKRKIHISWLIAIGSIGFSVGVFLAQYANGEIFSSLLILVISIGIIIICCLRRYAYLVPILIIGSIILGLFRGTIMWNSLSEYEQYFKTAVTVEASVKDDVDIGSSGQLSIRLDNIKINGKVMQGNLWVSASGDDIKRGDRLLVGGTLLEGFGNFAGVMYRANIKKLNIGGTDDYARVARDWFADLVRVYIPEPQSSLGIGFLVGQRRNLPIDLDEALKIAGLTHIVVASGYNLTILVRLARRLFEKVSKYLSALSSGIMIVSFIAITGASPSMSRAGLVASLSLAVWYYGRKFHPIVLLSFAVMTTLMINPSFAWGDLGWQLSFAAFFGVMIIAPLFSRYLFGADKPSFIHQILIETTSAQIATAPILVAAFGQLSIVAIISNLLVLPLVPLAMLMTFITGILGFAIPVFADFIGMVTTWLLGYMVNVAEFFASLSWATVTVNMDSVGLTICYGIIGLICIYMWRITGYNLRDANLVE